MAGNEIPSSYKESFESAFNRIDKRFEAFEKKLDAFGNKVDAVHSEVSNMKIDVVLSQKHNSDKTSHCKMDPSNGMKCVTVHAVDSHLIWHTEQEEKTEKVLVANRKRKLAIIALCIPAIAALNVLGGWLVAGLKAFAVWVTTASSVKPGP